MVCYVLKMRNCGHLCKDSNEYVYWILPQFQSIKETRVDLNFHKMLQCCVGKLYKLKMIDISVIPIFCGSVDAMVLNPTLDVFQPTLVVGGISKDRTTVTLSLFDSHIRANIYEINYESIFEEHVITSFYKWE